MCVCVCVCVCMWHKYIFLDCLIQIIFLVNLNFLLKVSQLYSTKESCKKKNFFSVLNILFISPSSSCLSFFCLFLQIQIHKWIYLMVLLIITLMNDDDVDGKRISVTLEAIFHILYLFYTTNDVMIIYTHTHYRQLEANQSLSSSSWLKYIRYEKHKNKRLCNFCFLYIHSKSWNTYFLKFFLFIEHVFWILIK